MYRKSKIIVSLFDIFLFWNWFRDAKQTRSLDLRLKNHVQDSGTTIRNPITIDSPSSASPPTTIFANPSLGFPRFLQVMKFLYVSIRSNPFSSS